MRWPWRKPVVLYAVGAVWGTFAASIAQSILRARFVHYVEYCDEKLEGFAGEIQPDWIFFLNWSHRVPESITNRYRAVNFHCSDLPQGRGGGPIENLILRGHSHTVITAHQMTQELDAGPIYCKSGPVSLDGTKEEIQQRFIEPVALMIADIAVNSPEPQPQQGTPTYFKRLTPADYEAFWVARGGRV